MAVDRPQNLFVASKQAAQVNAGLFRTSQQVPLVGTAQKEKLMEEGSWVEVLRWQTVVVAG